MSSKKILSELYSYDAIFSHFHIMYQVVFSQAIHKIIDDKLPHFVGFRWLKNAQSVQIEDIKLYFWLKSLYRRFFQKNKGLFMVSLAFQMKKPLYD